MRRYRLLTSFLVCLFLVAGIFSVEAEAGPEDSGFSLLQGAEEMVLAPSAPLRNPGKDILFEPVSGGVIKMGSFNNSRWFRISMKDLIQGLEKLPSYPEEEGILMFANPHVTHVDCFIPETPTKYARYTFGNASGNVLHFLYTRYPVLWMPPLKNFMEDGYVYLNVRSDYPVSAQLYLLAPRTFIRFFFRSLIIQLGFLGIMISFTVTYFLFYMMTGEKVYRTFMLIQLGMTLLISAFNGHLHAYLKLPMPVSTFMTWGAFGLMNIVGTRFFLGELQDRPRAHRLYRPALYFQSAMAPAVLVLAMSDRFFWVFLGALTAFSLSFAGSLLLFVSQLRKKTPPRALALYAGAHTTFFLGIGGMFACTYYAPHYFTRLSYPDLIYMVLLVISPFLLVWLLLSGSRVRFDSYNLLKAQSSHYRELSQRDGLTGLYNRSYLEHVLEESVKQARKTGKALAFIMLDIDHFKRYNDTWGHQEGDRALTLVARVIRDSLREQDVAARYGGEEFSVILSGASLPIACIVAERIRLSCEEHSSTLGADKTLTVSLGISLFHPGDTPETLIRRADDALYRAKKEGRNRMELESGYAPC